MAYPEVDITRSTKFRSKLGGLRETLDALQGSIYFVKKLTATNVTQASYHANRAPRRLQLTIPRQFTREHGNKFRRPVVLRSGLSNKPWRHRLSFCTSRPQPEVTFCGRPWRAFVTSNGLVEGDQLIFSLTAMSQFQVYTFDRHGDPKSPDQMLHAPMKWSDEAHSCLPSFSRRLVAINASRLEIPKEFVMQYGSRLRDPVQLQGIHENSPVQNVQFIRYVHDGRARMFLRGGWDDFVTDNELRMGQELVFTLTADSFFSVREEIYWSPQTGLNLGSQARIADKLLSDC